MVGKEAKAMEKEVDDRKEVTNLYIVHKAVLDATDQHLLKLNRDAHQLELYRKVAGDTLHKYYSIRPDFDYSDYVMFEKEKAFDCIFGGEETPTPSGIFRITDKSKEEYVSGYYAQRDKVKFFGYLVIFEDYFIHSDLYEENVTEDMMRSDKAIIPISHGDSHTAGCIRVSQKNADWLVEHIEIGTTVVM